MWQPFAGRQPAIVLIVLALAACAPANPPNIVEYDGEALSIAPPDGHCTLDPDDTHDQLFTSIASAELGSDVDFLVQYVPCEQLERWRGEGPYSIVGYGAVLVPFDLDPLGGTSRDKFVRIMERAFAEVDWGDFELDYNADDTRKLDRTDTALFIGWTYLAPGDDQKEEFSVVMAFTTLRGIPVVVIATAPTAYATFDGILSDLRPYVADLVEANP